MSNRHRGRYLLSSFVKNESSLLPVRNNLAKWLLKTIAVIVLTIGIHEISACSKVSMNAANYGEEDLRKLYMATDERQLAASLDIDSYRPLISTRKIAGDDYALWPVYNFLLGEVLRLRGDNSLAKETYRRLVEWAGARLEDQNDDGWGTSGLATVALWRWLRYIDLDSNSSSAEHVQLLRLGPQLLQTRFARGMFKTLPIFTSLPQIQEDILRRLVSIASKTGRKEGARNFLIEYFMNSSESKLNSLEESLLNEAISMGVFSRGRIMVLRAKHLSDIGNFESARSLLDRALEDENPQVQAEASLLLAELKRRLDSPCLNNELFNLYDKAINGSSNPDIIHEALLRRARASIRDGCAEDPKRFIADLNRIINDCPECNFTDDALLELASYYLDQYWKTLDSSSFDVSMAYFEKLLKFTGENDYIESCRFRPALALYSRGKKEDKTKARELLLELEAISPRGPFHSHAIFWLGRFAEEFGESELAEAYFKQLIKETPYGYYGIRAQIHLNVGASAKHEISPSRGTIQKLVDARDKVNQGSSIESGKTITIYQARLQSLLSSGVYEMAVGAFSRVRHDYPSERMETIPLEELDKKNMLAQLALLLATRQDAFAATDKMPDAKDRIGVAKSIGELTGDWPTTIYITGALDKPYEVIEANQNELGFRTAAFPDVYEEFFNVCSTRYNLPSGLLYGIVKRESAFSPDALSSSGAVGLFQFIPRTFDSLNNRYKLLQETGKKTREEFLLDPQLSLYLGARYLKEELLARYKGDIVFALMDHIAGAKAVREWRTYWQRINKMDDYEFMLESAGFSGVGPFVRAVLTAYWIKGLSK